MFPVIHGRNERSVIRETQNALFALKEDRAKLEKDKREHELKILEDKRIVSQQIKANKMTLAVDQIVRSNLNNGSSNKFGSKPTKNFRGIKAAAIIFNVPETTLRYQCRKAAAGVEIANPSEYEDIQITNPIIDINGKTYLFTYNT
jgi:hypothetical protein